MRSDYHVYDTRGNLTHTVDETSSVRGGSGASLAWTAWGDVVPRADGTKPSVGTWGYGAKFGYFRDSETGFYLATYRHYDPGAGRWITRDPINYAGGQNLYGYVGNDPVNAIDPSGLVTVAQGVEFGTKIGPFAVGVSFKQVVGISTQGVSTGLIVTPSFGPAFGAEAHGQVFGEVTDAYEVRDLERWSFEAGGSAGAGASGTLAAVSSGTLGDPKAARGVKAGIGIGGGGGIHGTGGYSFGLSTPIIPWGIFLGNPSNSGTPAGSGKPKIAPPSTPSGPAGYCS